MNETNYKWTTDPQLEFSNIYPTEKGSTLEIVLNGLIYTTIIDPITGIWSWMPETALADGQYSLSFRVIDKAGNIGAPTLLILNVDTTAPNKPEILRVIDDEGLQQSWLTPGARTDDKTPILSGSAEAGSIVRLYDGTNEIGSTKADENGRWEITPTIELSTGPHSFTVTSTDRLDHTSVASDAFSLTIAEDLAPPVGNDSTITHADDNAGSVMGLLKDGAITDDTTPTLHGTAPAGSIVRIQYRAENGSWIDGGNATLNGTNWTWEPAQALLEGKYEFRANIGFTVSHDFKLEIDLTPEDSFVITHAYDDFGNNDAELKNGATTYDLTPTLFGRGESNSLVYIHYRNNSGVWKLLASVTVGMDGKWKFDPTTLAPGAYEFTAENSAVHDVNAKTFELNLVIDGGSTPSINLVWDDVGNLKGEIKQYDHTNDTRPEFKGTADPYSVVRFESSKNNSGWQELNSVIADANGNWAYTPANDLEHANWSFRVKNGNGKATSNEFKFVIDNTDTRPSKYDLVKGKETFDNITDYAKKYAIPTSEGPITFSSGLILSSVGTPKNASYYTNGSPRLDLRPGSHFRFDFSKTGKTTDVSMNITTGDSTTWNKVTVYSTHGEILHNINYEKLTSALYSYTAPQGKFISHFEVDVGPHANRGMEIDNVIWGQSVSTNKISSDTLPDKIINDDVVAFSEYSDDINLSKILANNLNNSVVSLSELEINTLTLDVSSLLEAGDKDIFIDDGHHQLMIQGDVDDLVKLSDILPDGNTVEWTKHEGSLTIAGVEYQVFSANNQDSEVLVQQGVKVELI